MAFKGPTRTIGSVRDLRENGGIAAPTSEQLTAPKWLKGKARAIFAELVEKAVAAGIPTRQLDTTAFAMCAQYQLDYQEAKDPGLRARIGRDLMQAQKVIGANPEARIRMGIKGAKAAPSKTATLLAMAARRPPENNGSPAAV